MLTLHVAICFIGLLAGALLLIALCRGENQPAWAATLLATSALISLTGFVLPSPPGTPTPDPARIVGVVLLVVTVIATFALYARHLTRPWRAIYVVTIVLAVYFNAFVAVTQGFLKLEPLHSLAPTGKEQPFLIAQVLTLAVFAVVGARALRRFSRQPTAPSH